MVGGTLKNLPRPPPLNLINIQPHPLSTGPGICLLHSVPTMVGMFALLFESLNQVSFGQPLHFNLAVGCTIYIFP